MSDLCMYKLEDKAWDEFWKSEDHIVPHPGSNKGDDPSVLGESCQKPRFKGNTTSNCAVCAGQGKGQGEFSTLSVPNNMILEQDSWSPAPKSGFPTSSDSNSVKEVSSLVSQNSSLFGFKNNTQIPMRVKSVRMIPFSAIRSLQLITTPLVIHLMTKLKLTKILISLRIPRKKIPVILYYGWPEIRNFEDVERMF